MDDVANAKLRLDKLLSDYKVQPVGWGYIDCITAKENAFGFINSLTEMGIKISELTWWCHCSDWIRLEGNKETGCPHGSGGPRSIYFDGFFSELHQIPHEEFLDNNEVLHFVFSEWPTHKEYLPCLVPAFWLVVPDDWKNTVNA